MKVLHIGLMVNGRDEGLSAAFRERFTFANYREYGVSSDVANKVGDYNPDLVFLQIQSDNIGGTPTERALGGLLERLKNDGAFIINWTGDARNSVPSWMVRFAKYVDITAFSNERDVESFGYPSCFLQIGFDPKVFKKWETNEPSADVVFMGNDYGNQFPLGFMRRQLVMELQRYNSAIYGNYPQARKALNPDPKNPFPIQSQESKIYNNCKIAISMSHYQIQRYTSDRLFRCTGSGVMVLAHNYPGIEKDFKVGTHLDVFDDFRQMHEKINHYLTHEKERKAIAKAGYEYAHKNCTYDNMVENIINIYNENRK